ncbi:MULTISPECIES: transglycosylase domain-containing protein [unclassified Pseudofrankia]|uniref:transglycosylase domain-containing protein n=1 Tax=unclassified Pseudofrankia TaxID=2994372 RepID=UPI0008DA9DE9|nr:MULTISPECIES: transglycosylase domain-containing protein [unclassified Pseudofrankia]MDT3439023.1 transglycosylase domain-containing protein [Pseudofrankia sp. BMG5.37]OHV49433.1 twin-arginine translocation pathway signal protein [Pseudofrankia sp. BMG5.36]
MLDRSTDTSPASPGRADVTDLLLGVTATAAGRDTQTPVTPTGRAARRAAGTAPARRHAGRSAQNGGTGPKGRTARDGRVARVAGRGGAAGGSSSLSGLLEDPGPPEPPRRSRSWFAKRGVVLSLSIGLVMALFALPVVAGAGLFAKASADHFMGLPADLLTPPLPQNSQILAADGSVIATLHGEQNRVLAKPEEIPQVMRQAIVAIEDSRFYEHGGYDSKGMLRALLRNSESGDVQQGASTLTQQYVKNVLLQNARTPEERAAAIDTSVSRKLQELRYATTLEKELSKDEILVRYLNIAYFGDGAYGIGTAAQHFFGVNVSKLTLVQAALLAGLVQSPSRYNPVLNPKDAMTRRNDVLDRMVTSKFISATQAEGAKQMPITLNITSGSSVDSCAEASVTAPFFCDYVRTQLLASKALGDTQDERDRQVYEGGLQIHTTLDPKVQAAAQAAVDATVGKGNRVSATEVIVQPGTGNILAMAVNRDFGDDASKFQTKINLATHESFEPGSTFKAFTMAEALEEGYGLGTQFYSPACVIVDEFPLAGRGEEGGDDCANKGYSNAEPNEAGTFDMSEATWKSVNTYYIQLLAKVGVMPTAALAKRLGIPDSAYKDLPNGLGPSFGGLTLSQQMKISPLVMANAYATFAAGGMYCKPRYVTAATDSSNKKVDIAPAPDCTQAIDKKIADTVASVLAGVVTKGTGTKAAIGRPAAGKTGTNDDFTSAWFIGFTPQMSSAVAVGDPRGNSVQNALVNVQADGQTWLHVFGGDLPAIIFSRTLKPALQGVPVEQLPKADPKTAQGTKSGLQNPDKVPAPTVTPGPGIILGPDGQPLPGQPTITPQLPGQPSDGQPNPFEQGQGDNGQGTGGQ